MSEILNIKNLSLDFKIQNQLYPAISNVDMSVKSKEIIGIVGESGSGKSLTAKTIMGIAPNNAHIDYEILNYKGKDINQTLKKNRKNIQGKEISMIFQDSGSALNPLTRVGKQIQEVLKIHKINSKDQRKRMTMDLLGDVGFPDPQSIYRSFPHELSGGMRQRIMICMALIAEPDLIIADEPTTALDTTIQKQILDILYRLIREKEKSMIIITHDWGVINEMCDRVYVMYAGKVVEEGSVEQIVHHPRHSYTKALLKAIPSLKSKGHPLFYIPFKVSSITDRRHGEWPYLEFSKSNEEYIRKNFPEFIIEEYKSSKTASGNSKDDNKDKLTRSLAQDSKEEKSNGHASLPNYSDKAKADTIIHQVPDLPNLNNKSVKEKRDLEED